ncbi:MAG: DUF1266 domain-containing protein [Myxococcota bacterium]
MHDNRPPFALDGLSTIERAQRRALAVMSLMPERRSDDGGFYAAVARPLGTARALRALRDDLLEDENDLRRAILLRRTAARSADVAWNLVRAAVLGARGHTAYWFSIAEAWNEVVTSARELQRMHKGWFSMAEACLVGIKNQLGEAAAEAARAVYFDLHSRPDSPWNLVPWTTEIPAEIPPPRFELPVAHVKDGAELAAALRAPAPGTIIRLAPGPYVGAFVVDVPGVALIADAPGVHFVDDGGEAPAILGRAPCAIHGITFELTRRVPIVAQDFLRAEECRFVGNARAVVMAPPPDVAEPPTLQLARCDFTRTSDTAIVLGGGRLVADDVDVGPLPGRALSARAASIRMRDVRVVDAGMGFDLGDTPSVDLRRVRLERSGGILAISGTRLAMHECEVVEGDAVVVDGESEIMAERCRFLRARGSHVELVGSSRASFKDCDFLDSGATALTLRPGAKTEIVGGQIVGSADCGLSIEGSEDVRLDRVALGPNIARSAIEVKHSERVAIRSCNASGMGESGLDVRASDIQIDGFHIRGARHGVHALDARLHARRLDISEVRVAAMALEGTTLVAIGVGFRHVHEGLVLLRSTALVRDLVVGHHDLGSPDAASIIVLDEGARLALHIVDGVLGGRAKGGSLLGLSRVVLKSGALLVEGGSLFCDRSALRGVAAIAAHSGARLSIQKCELEEGAVKTTPECELVREATPTWTTAISPLLLVPKPEPFIAWGVRGDVACLARIARTLAKRLGYAEKLGLRETPQGLRVDGPLPVVARFASALHAVQAEAGALGAALAETLE